MDSLKRITIYFDTNLHKALKLRAAATDRSISETVNDAVRTVLAEDAEDLASFEERKHERNLSFDSFVQSLKRPGRI